ncbi:MAG: hypothetical protein WKF79_00450 [Nocardioides sp.]
MFDLRRPCSTCPFRKGQGSLFALTEERIAGIIAGTAFQCHKTVDYAHFDDDEARAGDRPQQCAGLMAVLHRSDQPNQIMQVASRLGALDLDALDPDGTAYSSLQVARKAHVEGVEP